jgi:hypothetical protein
MGPGAGASHITVNTSACRDGPVPVWTRKAGINGDFLNPASKDIFQISVKVIVSLTHFFWFRNVGVGSSLFLAN